MKDTRPKSTLESFSISIDKLVDKYEMNLKGYRNHHYLESSVEADFLEPLLVSLGWDVTNEANAILSKREVEKESRVRDKSKKRRADYLFRTDGINRFICEAKKPSESLDTPKFIFQTKRYAFNKGLHLAVLTNFEQIKIYIVGDNPKKQKTIEEGLWKIWNFREYNSIVMDIWNLLSRDAVASGSINKLIESLPKKARGKHYVIKPDREKAIDNDFLNFLDEARRSLASNLLKNNDREYLLEGSNLNEAIQRILDRILFLRICEDRDIDTGVSLQEILQTSESPWKDIVKHFKALDSRPPSSVPFFNGNLFKPHFCEELIVSDSWIDSFLRAIGDDESPYLFNSIPIEILGTIYERFLGKVIKPTGKGTIYQEKLQTRKLQAAYYTPRYIVDYIVEQTVGKLLEGKRPQETLKLKVLDPACGSGSFLIRAYERICEHWLKWLTSLECSKRPKDLCWTDKETNDVHLMPSLKRKILTSNIYGVDIDPSAVEVTQLSLYLKMLENESRATLQLELDFKDEPILPPMHNNIKCGNSLIDTSYFIKTQNDNVPDVQQIRPFDWNAKNGFSEIMSSGRFDAVIGNPPYLNIDDMWGKGDVRAHAIKTQYPHIYNDKTDILFYFLAKSLELSKTHVGFIVSRAFLEAFKADKLRECLSSSAAINQIVDFRNFIVFHGVGITTCIIILQPKAKPTIVTLYKLLHDKYYIDDLSRQIKDESIFSKITVKQEMLKETPWLLSSSSVSNINNKVDSAGTPLGNILIIGQGMQTGCNNIFGKRSLGEISKWRLKPTMFYKRARNSDIQRYFIRDCDEYLVFTNNVPSFDKLPVELQKYLTTNQTELKNRAAYKRDNCEWFHYTWPLHQEHYDKVKIYCPYLATSNRFALDDKREFLGLTDTTVLFNNDQPENILYLLGLLNSKLLTFRFKSIGKLKGGGVYEYFENSISKLPIRRIDFRNSAEVLIHDSLVSLVDKMNSLNKKADSFKSSNDSIKNLISATDSEIDSLVYNLYGLTPEEIKIVEAG